MCWEVCVFGTVPVDEHGGAGCDAPLKWVNALLDRDSQSETPVSTLTIRLQLNPDFDRGVPRSEIIKHALVRSGVYTLALYRGSCAAGNLQWLIVCC